MRSSFALVLVPFALSTLACSMLHAGAKADGGTSDGGAVAVVNAAPNPPPPTPDNVNQVARFPDEASLNNTAAKIADPHQIARNSVPGGAIVATLNTGTDTVQIASHDNFFLCSFSDPKNAGHTLEGWISQGAFVAGPTPSPAAGCPAGQVKLEFEDAYFCGRECKVDKDCPGGKSCSGERERRHQRQGGRGDLHVHDPAPGTTPSTPSAATTIVGVQPPPTNGTCPAKYILASDKMCHFECSKSPLQCPPKSRCTATLTTPTTPACEEQH